MNKLDTYAIDALEYLRNYCDVHNDCATCIFNKGPYDCILNGLAIASSVTQIDEFLKTIRE